MSKPFVAHDRLKALLSYDLNTGVLTWRVRRGGGHPGKEAGTRSWAGYRQVTVDGRSYLAHYLIWFYVTGAWPKAEVDHRDLDKSNNRFGNLRQATHSQNMANRPARHDNKSGFKGVSFNKRMGRFQAFIQIEKRHKYLGLFDTAEAASRAYKNAAEAGFGQYARAA